MKRIITLILVAASLPVLAGCSETGRRGTLVMRAPNRNMIFNPSYPTYVATTQRWSDWPSTKSTSPAVTYVDFSVSVYDRQDSLDSSRDEYRRRFYSTRAGGTRQ